MGKSSTPRGFESDRFWRGARYLPARPSPLLAGSLDQDAVALWPLAVEPRGRRHADSPVFSLARVEELRALRQAGHSVVPVLEHAGPLAGVHLDERPLGPSPAPCVVSGRRPLPLDEAGWEQVISLYVDALITLKSAGAESAVLAMHDDGLLAATLSPRTHPASSFEERLRYPLSLWQRCRAIGVPLTLAMTVEELCPGGLDATDGILIAQAFVAHGADTLLVSAGSEAIPSLKRRPTARGEEPLHLSSAAWLVGRVDVPIFALMPSAASGHAEQAARNLGLAGVIEVCEDSSCAS